MHSPSALACWMYFLPSTRLSRLSPDVAVFLATLGLCLIFLELNRPGRVLPGAIGLLSTLIATAALILRDLQPWAVGLILLAAVTLLLNLWRKLPPWLLTLTVAALMVGLKHLVKPTQSAPVRLSIAILCGGVVGSLGASLSRIALRARRLKAVD